MTRGSPDGWIQKGAYEENKNNPDEINPCQEQHLGGFEW
jgi:hypothetical protein